jgi:predicted esterase YcpF (UPF0227 family)
MIVYIHGFRSTGQGPKARTIKAYFGDEVLAADFPQEPDRAIATLSRLIETEDIHGLIGSSLGGFYTIWLAERYDLPAVLINPSIRPFETTERYLGHNTRDNGETFVWRREDMEALRRYRIEQPRAHYMLMLKQGDSVLDYRIARDYLPDAVTVIEAGGDHAFNDIGAHLGAVERFLNAKKGG